MYIGSSTVAVLSYIGNIIQVACDDKFKFDFTRFCQPAITFLKMIVK